MKLKHVNYILKLINHIIINQKKIKYSFKKELLPIIYFLKEFRLIYKFILYKNKYILIFFFKKIKFFNSRLHNFCSY